MHEKAFNLLSGQGDAKENLSELYVAQSKKWPKQNTKFEHESRTGRTLMHCNWKCRNGQTHVENNLTGPCMTQQFHFRYIPAEIDIYVH